MELSGQLYPQGKSPQYPLDRRLGGTQIRSGRGVEERNYQPPLGIEPYNPDRPARRHGLKILLGTRRRNYRRDLDVEAKGKT
jgi:hypothetical protein